MICLAKVWINWIGTSFQQKNMFTGGKFVACIHHIYFLRLNLSKDNFRNPEFSKISFFHSRPGAYLTDDPLTWFFDLTWTSYLFYWQYSTNCRRTDCGRTRTLVDSYLTVTPDFEHFCTVSGKIISNGFDDLIAILE